MQNFKIQRINWIFPITSILVELIEQHIKEEQEIVRRYPRSLLNKLDGTQRLKRGIYVDCCQRACTLREFMNYCPSIISQQNASWTPEPWPFEK